MDNFEKTPYETNPVESLADAVKAFVEAYDVLQSTLAEFDDEKIFSAALRTAMYQPVVPTGCDNPPICLYEIGVVFSPDEEKYTINNRKLLVNLHSRESDVRALFIQENDGILSHLCEILCAFLGNDELNEFVHAAVLRFLNECRRLFAMWE
jgi:hypothetical protein